MNNRFALVREYRGRDFIADLDEALEILRNVTARLRTQGDCKMSEKSSFRDTWQGLIDDGLIVANGQMRRNSNGELAPVYVLSDAVRDAMGLVGKDAMRTLALLFGDDEGSA